MEVGGGWGGGATSTEASTNMRMRVDPRAFIRAIRLWASYLEPRMDIGMEPKDIS